MHHFQLALASFFEENENAAFEDSNPREADAGAAESTKYTIDEDDCYDNDPPPTAAGTKKEKKSKNKSAASGGPRIMTLNNMASSSEEEDETGQAFYAGGSEHSGQQVLGPPRKKQSDFVSNLFRTAQESGAEILENPQSAKSNTSKM